MVWARRRRPKLHPFKAWIGRPCSAHDRTSPRLLGEAMAVDVRTSARTRSPTPAALTGDRLGKGSRERRVGAPAGRRWSPWLTCSAPNSALRRVFSATLRRERVSVSVESVTGNGA